MSETRRYDVIVVGGGNAALCAALSACEQGATVALLERAPEEERGGNSAFTGGSMRFAYDSPEVIYGLVPDLSKDEIANTDFGTYTEERFFDDLYKITQYRTDPELSEVLIKNSQQAIRWMRKQGIRYVPLYGRHAPNINGKFKFSNGSTLGVSGAGLGLVNTLYTRASRAHEITRAAAAQIKAQLASRSHPRSSRTSWVVQHLGHSVPSSAPEFPREVAHPAHVRAGRLAGVAIDVAKPSI